MDLFLSHSTIRLKESNSMILVNDKADLIQDHHNRYMRPLQWDFA